MSNFLIIETFARRAQVLALVVGESLKGSNGARRDNSRLRVRGGGWAVGWTGSRVLACGSTHTRIEAGEVFVSLIEGA